MHKQRGAMLVSGGVDLAQKIQAKPLKAIFRSHWKTISANLPVFPHYRTRKSARSGIQLLGVSLQYYPLMMLSDCITACQVECLPPFLVFQRHWGCPKSSKSCRDLKMIDVSVQGSCRKWYLMHFGMNVVCICRIVSWFADARSHPAKPLTASNKQLWVLDTGHLFYQPMWKVMWWNIPPWWSFKYLTHLHWLPARKIKIIFQELVDLKSKMLNSMSTGTMLYRIPMNDTRPSDKVWQI